MDNVKAVVFDMDGVLLDTERLSLRAWHAVAGEHGIENIDEAAIKCIGRSTVSTLKLLGDTYPGLDVNALHDEIRIWIKTHIAEHGLPVKEGAEDILKALWSYNIPIALASSTRYATVCDQLKRAGLFDYFTVIIGGDMIEKSKPEPDIYLAACEKLMLDPRCAVAVEDSFNGIRSAKAAGMHTIMVPDILQPDDEIAGLVDYLCKDLAEAKQLLKQIVFYY